MSNEIESRAPTLPYTSCQTRLTSRTNTTNQYINQSIIRPNCIHQRLGWPRGFEICLEGVCSVCCFALLAFAGMSERQTSQTARTASPMFLPTGDELGIGKIDQQSISHPKNAELQLLGVVAGRSAATP